jgi:hypothetical protein
MTITFLVPHLVSPKLPVRKGCDVLALLFHLHVIKCMLFSIFTSVSFLEILPVKCFGAGDREPLILPIYTSEMFEYLKCNIVSVLATT